MSALHGKSNRRILPRWRRSKKASQAIDFASLRPIAKVLGDTDAQLWQATDDFARSPTIGTAAELVSLSLLTGRVEVGREAINFIRDHEGDAPNALLRMVNSGSEGGATFNSEDASPGQWVAQTRKLLRIYPDNPILWSDMARHHASLGQKAKAYRCMTVALQSAPNHRWMLRNAARFLVHQEDPIAAHKLVSNHPRTRNDPWLIAAELACAHVAERAPKYWRQAIDILKAGAMSPPHISELATAVAMMELEAGERKKARRYVEKGLIAPTENTLAQISWAKENRHLSDGYRLNEIIESTDDAYEAGFRVYLNQGRLLHAMRAAETWAMDEPFAARPLAEIAYVASLLDDYDLTAKMVNKVTRLDGYADVTLQMNNIFAMLSSGRLRIEDDSGILIKLHSVLSKAVESGGSNSYHAIANLALWNYRYGDASLGKNLYRQAIAIAQKLHLTEAAIAAATFAAREAILAKEASASAELESAKELAKKSKNKISEFYLRKLDLLLVNPENVAEILSPASAHRFLRLEREAPLFRVEKTDKGQMLWIPKKLG